MIVVLGVITTLMAVVAIYAESQRTAIQSSATRINQLRAKSAAESGVQYALSVLETQDANAVTADGDWGQVGENIDEVYRLGTTTFRVQVLDANSLVDLNSATQEQLVEIGLTNEQADSILDWRETDLNAVRPEGAKDEFYNNLSNPYNTGLRPFRSVDELMLVKGFIPSDIYGVLPTTNLPTESNDQGDVIDIRLSNLLGVQGRSPFARSDGSARENINQATVQQLDQLGLNQQAALGLIQFRNQNGSFTSLGQLLQVPGLSTDQVGAIIDAVSLNGETTVDGKMNLNTVTRSTLLTLPDTTTQIADAIVAQQATGFTGLSTLVTMQSIPAEWLQAQIDRFCTGSYTFLVRAIGTFQQTQFSLEALVSIERGSPQIISMTELPYSDMSSRWGWSTTPGQEITLAE